jgi:hypothetical protein
MGGIVARSVAGSGARRVTPATTGQWSLLPAVSLHKWTACNNTNVRSNKRFVSDDWQQNKVNADLEQQCGVNSRLLLPVNAQLI